MHFYGVHVVLSRFQYPKLKSTVDCSLVTRAVAKALPFIHTYDPFQLICVSSRS